MGIAPDDEINNIITIGQETMRGLVTIFDFKKNEIGFIVDDKNRKNRLKYNNF